MIKRFGFRDVPKSGVYTSGAISAVAVDDLVLSNEQSSSVDLVWSATDFTTSYRIEYKESASGVWLTDTTQAGTTRTVSGLSPDTSYDFRIISISTEGDATGNVATTSTTVPVPDAFALTSSVLLDGDRIRVIWGNVQYADSFDVFIREVGAPTYTTLVTGLASNETQYIFDYANFNTEYDIKVVATNATGSTEGTVNQWSAAPEVLVIDAYAVDYESIYVEWNLEATAVSYEVQMFDNTVGSSAGLTFPVGNVASTTITGLDPEHSYSVRVATVNTHGIANPEQFRNVVVTPAPPVPATPTFAEISAPTSSSIYGVVDAGADTDSFRIEYKESSSGVWTLHEEDNIGGEIEIFGLTPDTAYDVRATPKNAFNEGTPAIASTTTPVSIPEIPVFSLNSVIDPSNDDIDVSWTTSGAETDEFLVQYNVGGGAWQTFSTLGSAVRTETITGLSSPNTLYGFRVVASNAFNTSNSNELDRYSRPNPPQNVQVQVLDGDSILVTWDAPTNGAANYRIDDTFGEFNITSISNAVTSYQIDALPQSQSFDVRVWAENRDESENAGGVSVTIQPPVGAVSGLVASNITKTGFNLNWTDDPNVDTYVIETSPAGQNIWTEKASLSTGSSLLVSGLTSNTNYDVRVTASHEWDSNSATIQVTTANVALLRPDADVSVSGWTSSPFFSKINDASDATFIVSGNSNGDTVTVSFTNTSGSTISQGTIFMRVRKQAGGESATSFGYDFNINGGFVTNGSQNISSTSFTTISLNFSVQIGAGQTATLQLTRSGGGNPNNRRGVDCADVWIQET